MQPCLRLMLLASALVVSITTARAGEVVSTYGYCNARFDFCVDVPLAWEQQEAPTNGDGATFTDSAGMTLTVSGNLNPLLLNVSEAMQQAAKPFSKVTYRKQGKDWFVLSGYVGDQIVYLKEYVGDTEINSLRLEYPKARKQHYDAEVNEVVKSFTPDHLNLNGTRSVFERPDHRSPPAAAQSPHVLHRPYT